MTKEEMEARLIELENQNKKLEATLKIIVEAFLKLEKQEWEEYLPRGNHLGVEFR